MIYFLVLGSFLLFFYWYFSAKKLDFPGPTHYPFFGTFFEFFKNRMRFYDWIHECALKYGSMGILYFSMPLNQSYILLLKPTYVKHILKKNMDNYHRKPIHEIFYELMGDGIFNADGKIWRKQRKRASHMFNTRRLNNKAFDTFIECSDKLVKIIVIENFDLQLF